MVALATLQPPAAPLVHARSRANRSDRKNINDSNQHCTLAHHAQALNMASSTIVDIDLKGLLPKVASGKVRDLFAIDDNTLLFVASDRISAYDVVMQNVRSYNSRSQQLILISLKGNSRKRRTAYSNEVYTNFPNYILFTPNAYSVYWFKYLQNRIPTLKTHFIKQSLPEDVESSLGDQSLLGSLQKRSMQVRRLQIVPVESIVRGYITGSGWAEYKKSGTVNGIKLPSGLLEGQQLPKPLWTPSTKAEAGAKDENISPEKARELIGDATVAKRIEELSLEIYTTAAKRAEEVGIILADTKFEFGLTSENEVVLVDEVLTPDSSRFWPKDTWEQNIGKQQPSFDKQYLRDWLVDQGLKGKEGVVIPENIAAQTAVKYGEAYQMLTGEKLHAA
ncbi:unnamed protein product [Periconia digitata]|uniref:Phosphoribosylaminoimidazole-succinocarboxamide synthase n=1 Tax=Periconia digitata TaxID=1303443 RepID=A0A9W4UJ45_9PLEO|nr:unnamed protein product [Periconia digitata]